MDKSGIHNVASNKVDAISGRKSIIDLMMAWRQYGLARTERTEELTVVAVEAVGQGQGGEHAIRQRNPRGLRDVHERHGTIQRALFTQFFGLGGKLGIVLTQFIGLDSKLGVEPR